MDRTDVLNAQYEACAKGAEAVAGAWVGAGVLVAWLMEQGMTRDEAEARLAALPVETHDG